VRKEQWELFKRAAKRQPAAAAPLALIVDSPWIPGYFGISHLDYYLDPEVWFQANLKLLREFPDIIFFPSWWMEYGMAIEPSAAGTPISFWMDQTPSVRPSLFSREDFHRLQPIDPHTDGFMALTLHRYRMQKQRILDEGYTIPVVTARGPLCTAAFLRDVNELMVDMVEEPSAAHELLSYTTDLVIRWLQAQAEVIGAGVEGIFLLDDIAGFLSRDFYLEFAHPYLRKICEAFPPNWVKVYHNDASISQFLEELPGTGFDVLNFTHKLDIGEALRRTGGKMCLMGNVAPLDLGVRGKPSEIRAAAEQIFRKTDGKCLILSLGGGMSPGMPKQNVQAMVEAARAFNLAPSSVYAE
jgi:uroporphyrinogen decarboxylase